MPSHPLTLEEQQFAATLLGRMTLGEKIGQMTQPEKNSVRPGDVARLGLGSVLSGGGGNPDPNTPESWRAMVSGLIGASLESRLKIWLGTSGLLTHLWTRIYFEDQDNSGETVFFQP